MYMRRFEACFDCCYLSCICNSHKCLPSCHHTRQLTLYTAHTLLLSTFVTFDTYYRPCSVSGVLSALLSALYGTEAALSATDAAQKAHEALKALAAHYTPQKSSNNSTAADDDATSVGAKHELPPFTTQLDAAVVVAKVTQLNNTLKHSLRHFFQKHHRYTAACMQASLSVHCCSRCQSH
jgi:hypothetical protein